MTGGTSSATFIARCSPACCAIRNDGHPHRSRAHGPGGLALFERILSILLEAGFSPESAFDAYTSLYLFTLGFTATAGRSPAFREIQGQGVLYMGTLPEDLFPSIRTAVPVIGRRSLDEQFELALDVVIEGIGARLPRG